MNNDICVINIQPVIEVETQWKGRNPQVYDCILKCCIDVYAKEELKNYFKK